MLIIDKVMEITEGNYHYRSKRVAQLLYMEMRSYSTHSFAGDDLIHYIESPVNGQYGYLILALTKTKSGKNKDSWRIISTYR